MPKERLKVTLVVLVLVLVIVAAGTKLKAARVRRLYVDSRTAYAAQIGSPAYDDLWLLSRVVSGEAHNEPHVGQVAVAAVILNRVKSPKFPATVSGVIYEPDAFECVSNGVMWSLPPDENHRAAAQAALDGWDPTYGSLYFWNPAKAVSPWIWTRKVITTIGRHVFGL
ncbi:MAG: spore cortex-lytic protein [Firmicutes bacterium]|nr:spore cortex-lytic protein [Bacillota bacterium]